MSGTPYFPQREAGDGGEYRLLCKHLRERFADRLVLTFGQIEDVRGSRPRASTSRHNT
jgi:hypothetical protein